MFDHAVPCAPRCMCDKGNAVTCRHSEFDWAWKPQRCCVKSHVGWVDEAIYHVLWQDDELADTTVRSADIFVIFLEPDSKQLPVQNGTTTNTSLWRHRELIIIIIIIIWGKVIGLSKLKIDRLFPEADSQTDVFEVKEAIAFLPSTHLKKGSP